MTKCKYFFITGTDTNIGKTTVSCAILKVAKSNGYKVIGCKPVSSGCKLIKGCLINQDSYKLKYHSNVKLKYKQINPISFIRSTVPYIANIYEKKIFKKEILSSCIKTLKKYADLLIIEGAGGWFTPLDKNYLYSEWVIYENLPVILVIGIKLGCINHAILTEQTIINSKLNLIGWIANFCDNKVSEKKYYLDILKNYLQSTFLGSVPFSKSNREIKIENYVDIMLI